MDKKKQQSDLVSNRQARFQYEILDTYEAGIVLKGTEVKSLRAHDASLQEAYIKIIQNEAFLIGCYIAPYSHGNIYNHEPRQDRKLLLHKREIQKLKKALQEKGLSLIPLALYLSKGKIKIKIGLGRGKKQADKRQSIKERDEKRRMQKITKHYK